MKAPKQDPGIEINSEKYFTAQAHWVSYWGMQGMPVPNFRQFLGMTKGMLLHKRKPNRLYTMKIRASAARKIEKLASPHWYTILKAHQIRKHPHD